MARRNAHGATRRRIVELLRQYGSLTAAMLAEQLGVSAVAVRQHLAQLQLEGLVTSAGTQQGAGRPSQLFELTAAADTLFPHAYARLALDLLLCATQHDSQQVDQLFRARQQLLAQRYADQLAGLPLQERLSRLAHLLTEQGYMAECLTLDDGSLMLVQHHCPIVQVASDYQQACSCERALYQQVLEAPVVSESTIAGGAHCCRYRINS